jgi:hypothetical protein
MRDFRDAKAMAHTLRSALAAKGIKITVGQSLELIAQAFGVADWNTLAATIKAAAEPQPMRRLARPEFIDDDIDGFLRTVHLQVHLQRQGPLDGLAPPGRSTLSPELAATIDRASTLCKRRAHEFMTLEHLLLALTEDADAVRVIKGCGVDISSLRSTLVDYVDHRLEGVKAPSDNFDKPRPTLVVQRVITRALTQVVVQRRGEANGSDVLLQFFAQEDSPAASLLAERGMSRLQVIGLLERDADGEAGKQTP